MGKACRAHRVVWALAHGQWPVDEIDHINGDRADNRLVNLRSVTGAENKRNKRTPSNNKSGAVGVFWLRDNKTWRAAIRVAGRQTHIGCYATFDEAVSARKAAEVEHDYHPNHGRNA